MPRFAAVLYGLAILAASGRQAIAVVYNYPADPLPAVVAAGDTLNVEGLGPFGSSVASDTGSTVNFLAGGGIFSLQAQGEVNFLAMASGVSSLTVDDGVVHASGGVFGQRANVQSGGHVLIDGGNFLAGVRLTSSTAEFRSGGIGGAEILDGSTLSVFGAGVVSEVQVIEGALNIHGGGLALHPMAPPTATILSVHDELNLFVRSASINGIPLAGLQLGVPVTVPDRGVDLSTVLADGTFYIVPLTPAADPGNYDFYSTSQVTVTLVPEPSAGVLAIFALGWKVATRRRAGR